MIKLIIHHTGQEHEWWAPVVITGAAAGFVISFFVIAGSELIGDCWEAIAGLMRRIKGG
jgi:hypothetical protein